jgi:hypothetical protein
MTVVEVVDPVMLPIACALAVVAILFFFWHVARRYPSAPKIVPLRLRIDGRPGQPGRKRWLWLPPAILAAVAALLSVVLLRVPAATEPRAVIALVFLTIAEVAVYGVWQTDRQIELARKMTYRVAPVRTLRALFPILVTTAVTIAIAVRP